jgi:hypothetical protein
VLDAAFNYLGEHTLDEGPQYFTGTCFVTKEGLHIQVESDNEDYMSFHTYEFVNL